MAQMEAQMQVQQGQEAEDEQAGPLLLERLQVKATYDLHQESIACQAFFRLSEFEFVILHDAYLTQDRNLHLRSLE